MGSVMGTVKDMVDDKREEGEKIGPFQFARSVLFLRRKWATHFGTPNTSLWPKRRWRWTGRRAGDACPAGLRDGTRITQLVIGLGGRPVFKKSLSDFVARAEREKLEGLQFLDISERHYRTESERAAQQQQGDVEELKVA